MGFLSIFLITLAFVCAFLSGVLFGWELGFKTSKAVIVVCDACGNVLDKDDVIYCEDCHEEDSLDGALKERELSARYNQSALKTRGIINRPRGEELETMGKEAEKTKQLCSELESVADKLKVKMDVSDLRRTNEQLLSTIKQWEQVDTREGAIDRILQREEDDAIVDTF